MIRYPLPIQCVEILVLKVKKMEIIFEVKFQEMDPLGAVSHSLHAV